MSQNFIAVMDAVRSLRRVSYVAAEKEYKELVEQVNFSALYKPNVNIRYFCLVIKDHVEG